MKNILRVFISSTFNDFRLERAVLQKYIFPKVKEEANKRGISFLPIDLRWGVPEEAQVDHRTMDICLSEVERSVTQPHPDFIILSGDKYGWIPIPRVIEKEEFETVLNKLKELNEDTSILKKWYELDENQLSTSYILKSRDEIIDKDYTNWENWAEVEDKIRTLLQKAVNNLDLSEEQKEKYFISATHEEFRTFLKYKKNKKLKNNIISFIREFKDIDGIGKEIKEKLADENREKIEVFRKEIKENTAKENLKEKKVISKVYEKLIEKYSQKNKNIEEVFKDINTLEEIRGSLGNEEFEEYLIEFARFIEEKLINSLEHIKTDFNEKDYQQDFKNFLLNKPFFGRNQEIKEILEAIKNNDKVLIYGESGVGKSSIIARVIDKLEKEKKIVYRFSGATQTSSNLINMLNSILEELGIEVEKKENKTDNLNQQKDLKTELLKIGEKLNQINKEVIIIIDAIDQLKSANYDELEWLPNNKNIKIVISVLKDKNYKEDSLYFKKLNQMINSVIEIKRIKNKKELLQKLLETENRTLQENQFEYVLNKKDSDKPLYLTIAKEELKFWRSYDELADNSEEETKTKRYLSPTQKEIIKEFFNNLKTMHNIIPELVERVLGYISTSQEYLSEELLLEVLSKDKELLSKIENKHHKNLTNELPPAVWSRFRWMIREYIKEEDGYIRFYHREFEDIIDEYYNKDLAKTLTLKLEDLFPDENALTVHAYTLANRVNHNEEIGYQRIADKLENMDEGKTEEYLYILLNEGDKISKFTNLALAFGYLQAALNISKLLYEKNPNRWIEYYSMSLNNLESLYQDTEKIKEIENLLKEALKIRKKAYEQNPERWIEDYSGSLNNLGSLYCQTGKFEESGRLLKEALKIRKKAYEQNPERWIEDYSTSLNNLGYLYYQTNKIEEAERLYKEILKILENVDYLTSTIQLIKQNAIGFFE